MCATLQSSQPAVDTALRNLNLTSFLIGTTGRPNTGRGCLSKVPVPKLPGGLVAHDQRNFEQARAYHEQALALNRRLGNLHGEASNLGNLAGVAHDQRNFEQARAYHEQSLALHRDMAHPLGEAEQLGNLGFVAKDQGDLKQARAYLEQSAALYRHLDLPVHPSVQAALEKITGPD